jgi:hypothetical protein
MCVRQLPNTARLSRHSVHITHPRRADARRSCLSVPVLPLNSAYLLPHSAGVGHHGGLTPAALDCVRAGRRTMLDFHSTALVSPTTAGLGSPLDESVRYCDCVTQNHDGMTVGDLDRSVA